MTKERFDLLTSKIDLTEEEKRELEPYRVKKAFLFAAGFGSRMVPVTLDTPKPMVKVNGVRIIDTIIDALVLADITDITIVRGYKKDCFNELLEKYPFIRFVDNDDYDKMNNISSAMKVIDEIDSCYVFDSDLILRNPDLVQKYQYESNILGHKAEYTDDWCVDSDGGYATNYRKEGNNCYQTVVFTFWTREDSVNLRKKLKERFDSEGGHDTFWEFIPLIDYKDDFKVRIRECVADDIQEIDNFYELVELDPSYEGYVIKSK